MVAFWVMVAAAALGAVSALWHLPALLGPARPFGVRIPAELVGDAGIVASNRRYHVHVVAAACVLAGVTSALAGARHWPVATIASGTAAAVVALFAVGGLCYWRTRATIAGLVRTWPAGAAAIAGSGVAAVGAVAGRSGAGESEIEAAGDAAPGVGRSAARGSEVGAAGDAGAVAGRSGAAAADAEAAMEADIAAGTGKAAAGVGAGPADTARGTGTAAEAGIRQDAGSGSGVRGPARSRSGASGARRASRHHPLGTAEAGYTAKPGPRLP
ncbi:hypothetical protein Raf01_35420 [Rugosimonospora africana]|uniref:Uncharacterized protein n=2 Tax=Rugosimonospora africana TaxID=556532 RepID=A0A8J3VQQ0_9ACTN|nr:hypothetical protein Raf01_35420 [Rugosimonospora africana]